MAEVNYYRRGFGLKSEIEGSLWDDYHSRLVDHLRSHGFRLRVGGLTIRLAAEFGFCYGVDRAVEYAYETRTRFPDRNIFITGEIIHNPHVNARLREMKIQFMSGHGAAGKGWDAPGSRDVVILPAFGVTVEQFDLLRGRGCTLVDTTCGSVLNVWKNVERYARDGFTALIHGKYSHEETRATASRTELYPGGKYLVVRDLEETDLVCDFIRNGAEGGEFESYFSGAAARGFEPERDLERIGVANQTTMLSSESLEVAARIREAMADRFGEAALADHFRSFDTICSATQDRQDAVQRLLEDGVRLMLVIGGYNSSNTNHLAEMAIQKVPTYHIEDSSCLLSAESIRHKPVGQRELELHRNWFPPGEIEVGVTAGASTPNNRVGEVVERLLALRGVDPSQVFPA